MRPVEVSMNQRLLYDLIRAKRGRAAIMSNDAWGCYDRIAHIAILLALRRLGIPRPPILAMLETIQKMRHFIRTAFGESAQSYGGDPSKAATQGILQGNGAGPAGWFAICSIMIDCMKAEGFGYADWSAISNQAMHLVCFAFVDDTDLVHATFDSCLTSTELIAEAQQALLTWESLLSATGGALKPSKSYWYLLDYTCVRGVWKPKRIQDAPGELSLHNQGQPFTIQRLEVTEAREALGIMSRPDCSMDDQVEAMKAKVAKWVDGVRTKRINSTNAWYCLNSTIMKTLEYPLMATTLTADETTSIMWPLLQAALPKCRVQKRFPRKLMFGTSRSQGMAVPSLMVTQTVQHVQAIIRHSHRSSPSHDLHLHNMEAVQCHLGSEIPFWQLPFELYGGLAPEGWMKFTWKQLSQTSLTLRGPLAVVAPKRQRDVFIMDALVHEDWPLPERRYINEVRLHLGVTVLSELSNAAGTHIDPWIWQGKQRSKLVNAEAWPNTRPPSPRAVERWQAMLKELFSDPNSPSHSLRSPLGPWLEQLDSEWIWWHDPVSNRVLEHKLPHEWHHWTPLPIRYQQQHFRHQGIEPDPPFETLSRISVKVARVRLVITSLGEAPAHVPPLEHLTLHSQLESLPSSAHWAVKHASVDDDGLCLSLAIARGEAVAVSDASLHGTSGTTSTVIEGAGPEHRLLCHTQVPGPVREGDSLRCELAGNYTAVLCVNAICAQHNVTHGSITVACDNINSLRPFKPDYLPNPKDKNLDLMQAVWASVQDSPITWNPVHVHGHQDRKVRDAHRRLALLNCEMDARAKLFYRHLRALLPTMEAPQIPIHNEGWTVWSGDLKLPSPSRECLYEAIQDPVTQLYWIRHQRFSFDARLAIDWETCAAGMKALQPARRRWIAKHASSNCGVGKTLVTWKYQDDDRCPRCRLPEDTTHVLRCTAKGANDVWNESITKLTAYLQKTYTHPGLQESLLTSLHRWRHNSFTFANFAEEKVNRAVTSQSSIGWKNLLEGLLSASWRQLQQRYYHREGCRKSSKRWAKGLFVQLHHLAWNQWDHRNKIKHDFDRARYLRMERRLDLQIQRFYAQSRSELPPRERYHFRLAIPALLNKPLSYKQNWFRNVTAAKQRAAQRRANAALVQAQSLEQSALLRWMKTSRPS